jgi:hypothetical protein
MVLKKLYLVTWKNLIIRRRHWILTLIEIVIPILLFIVVAGVRSNIVSSVDEPQHYNQFILVKALEESNKSLSDEYLLMYAPNETYTSNIVSLVTHDLHKGTGKKVYVVYYKDCRGLYTLSVGTPNGNAAMCELILMYNSQSDVHSDSIAF